MLMNTGEKMVESKKAAERIIEVNHVSMLFNLAAEKVDNLKEYFIRLIKRKLHFKEYWVLNDINVAVKRGESLGLIGNNGAGKSTLLKLIAGVLEPTKGKITTKGVIAPLINLGAGFDMEASAKDNIYLNGAILGFSKKEMQEKFALTNEQASASVSFMDSIRGSIIWIAFIDNADGSIRVRLRSRFVPVNTLAEKYRGGGHACACGATLYSKEEMAQFIADADALIKEYKENNEGWL